MAKFENITLEKGMYGVPGKTFTQVLEELDSSEEYRGTPLEGLDAYQRQLKRFGIKVSGPGSDRVEKFFTSSASAALFPEYVGRAVAQGLDRADRVRDLVATVTKIDALDYRAVSITEEREESGEVKTGPVAETVKLPRTTLKMDGDLVSLKKRGRLLVSSYEALRFQKLDLFTVALKRIGASIAQAQMGDAVDALTEDLEYTAGTPEYGDFVKLWAKLAPYQLNVIAAGTDAMEKILGIAEFKDAAAGNDFQGSGRLCTPLGAKLIHLPGMAAGKLVALDSTCALEMIQAGEVHTEYDKLIDRQLERAAISVTAGFSKIYGDAVQGLSYGEEA